MGSYVGSAVLVDEQDATVRDVRIAVACMDPTAERWRASVEGAVDAALAGRRVTVQLPNGIETDAIVLIDLTGDEPVVHLQGSGPGPV